MYSVGLLCATLAFRTKSSKPPLYVCLRHEVRTDGGQRHDVRAYPKVQDPARHHAAQSAVYDRAEVTHRHAGQAGVSIAADVSPGRNDGDCTTEACHFPSLWAVA